MNAVDLQESLQRSGATVYGMRYSTYLTPFTTKPEDYEPAGGNWITGIQDLLRLGKRNTMEMLTQTTGGMDLGFETKSKLEKDLMRLAGDIHNRYLVSFVPAADQETRFHRITLQVKNRPDAVILTRPGYWSFTE